MRRNDLTGRRFDRLLVIRDGDRVRKRDRAYLCRCDCGAEIEVFSYALLDGKTRSCGCLRRDYLATFSATADAARPELFWSHVDKSGGPEACWPWTLHRRAFGYGITGIGGGRTESAHRVALRLSGVTVPRGASVCHRCDNPPCCNPAHLYVGDYATNAADRERRGRGGQAKRAGLANHNSRNLSGLRFARLVVVSIVPYDPASRVRAGIRWRCVCDCGREVVVLGKELLSGGTRSCGCLQRERARARMLGPNNPARRQSRRIA